MSSLKPLPSMGRGWGGVETPGGRLNFPHNLLKGRAG